jgi:hypothetical protein
MSYTWEAWALDPRRLLAELRTPSLAAADVRVNPLDDVLVTAHRRWDELGRRIADALAAGGGDLTGDLANYVVLVVRSLGAFAGSVGHTSSGGEWFREELLGRDAAAVLGRDTVLRLLARELGGLTLLDGPMLGWLDFDECQRAADQVADFEPDDDTSEDLWQVLDAVTVGATRGTGLVTLYV